MPERPQALVWISIRWVKMWELQGSCPLRDRLKSNDSNIGSFLSRLQRWDFFLTLEPGPALWLAMTNRNMAKLYKFWSQPQVASQLLPLSSECLSPHKKAQARWLRLCGEEGQTDNQHQGSRLVSEVIWVPPALAGPLADGPCLQWNVSTGKTWRTSHRHTESWETTNWDFKSGSVGHSDQACAFLNKVLLEPHYGHSFHIVYGCSYASTQNQAVVTATMWPQSLSNLLCCPAWNKSLPTHVLAIKCLDMQ